MAKRNNLLVFLDVSIDGDPFEKMVFELFFDVAPKTAENFRALCTGEKGVGPRSGRPLHYKGSFFHRIVKGHLVEGGDFVKRDGTGGESIYGVKFPDESPKLKHDGPGLLSMPLAERDSLGSHFVITFAATHNLDRKHIVFGKLVHGHELLKKIESVGDDKGMPTVTVKIINCGEYDEDKKKRNKLKIREDVAFDANSHEARRKGKLKKSSRDKRRKRRRHYSSDSESSSDTESESSESDSDSDSSLSSSSFISSSSDDRCKQKKKSSKREKNKHRDKRRDKTRRRRDKRSKHRSRRASESSTETESDSETTSEGDVKAKNHKHKRESSTKAVGEKSSLNGEKNNALVYKRRDETDILDNEDDRSPKDNGDHQRNDIQADFKSDRSGEGQPDIVDDHPGKSRSRSLSPKRTISKSTSITPRSLHKSPSVSPKRHVSRSSSVYRSPPPRSRSLTRSPVRSDSSRSPVSGVSRSPQRGWRGRSISESPARTRIQKRISRSGERSLPRRSPSMSPRRSPSRSLRKSLPKSITRSPLVASRSRSRSPFRSSRRSGSRNTRRNSRSPIRAPNRNTRRSYSRSPSPVHRARSPPSDRLKSLSRSVSPDGSPKRIRRGRGFSERYSYARRYRTPSPSPVRSYRYGGRTERDRFSSYRRYSPRRYRSPPRGRTPVRSRRSRTRSVSCSPPRYRSRRYSRGPIRSPIRSRSCSQSPIHSCSRSPVHCSKSHASPRNRNRSPSRSMSSLGSPSPPRQTRKSRSRSSSSGSLDWRKNHLVSYGDPSPDP
ncbi:peptidyl-prolyl cis-trans isomerase CYP95 isoform X2 [Humulus lupulus]|uniref:peptidyl-prolyl cis-trans isomerase CYP95 isoform X2 n=1 Tax=Humulus lupulus TaxID=3486 RepID=UPI002B4074AF|nr:peptidyl-prolyl cis-trans isomerase CYP95 isoform X2 [Humulus lupulus]